MFDSIVEQCSWVLEAQRKVKEYTHGILNFKSSQISCQIILTFYLHKFLYRHIFVFSFNLQLSNISRYKCYGVSWPQSDLAKKTSFLLTTTNRR